MHEGRPRGGPSADPLPRLRSVAVSHLTQTRHSHAGLPDDSDTFRSIARGLVRAVSFRPRWAAARPGGFAGCSQSHGTKVAIRDRSECATCRETTVEADSSACLRAAVHARPVDRSRSPAPGVHPDGHIPPPSTSRIRPAMGRRLLADRSTAELYEDALRAGEGVLAASRPARGPDRQAHRPLAQGQVHCPRAVERVEDLVGPCQPANLRGALRSADSARGTRRRA